jgi:UDP-2-acetamido-3-amino-2,3-dideoxy-glucuronate N-acetyltransferase
MIIFPEIVNIDPFMKYFAHATAVIDEGALIGSGTKIWHFSHIMGASSIGENCTIGQNVMVAPGVVLGRGVKVQNNVSLYTGVICGDGVFIGPSAVFTNVINPRSALSRKDQFRPTRIGQGATIGANATILCGLDIGQYAFIGAGAVVTHPVPAYALVIGNPARQTGWMSEYGHRLRPDTQGRAICPESGEVYRLTDNQLTRITE